MFPKIGEVADQTDLAPTQENTEDEERTVQEIESLCMQCEQQVRLHPSAISCTLTGYASSGRA